MYSIYGKTFGMAMAALWVLFTPTQPVPPTPTATYSTLLHPSTSYVALGSQSEAPTSVELRVPEALINALLTEEHPSETLDLRVPEALLEHLHGAGQVSGLEKSPAPWGESFWGKISAAPDWSQPGYAPARTGSGQRWPPAEPLPGPARDQYAPHR